MAEREGPIMEKTLVWALSMIVELRVIFGNLRLKLYW